MLNVKWVLFSLLFIAVPHVHADISTASEDLMICSTVSPECKKVSCLDQCLLEIEDPDECPDYCNIQAVNVWKRLLAKSR